MFGVIFNASHDNNTLKSRSDDKGPEPEGVTVAEINGRVYAFVALERIGGCMVYDVTSPANPVFVDYKNTITLGPIAGGDNGSEGIAYISAANSPTGNPIVVLANEISSTLSRFTVNNSVLDITLRDVKALNAGNRNQVEWSTADEQQGDIFELQKSKDAVRFSIVTAVSAKGAASSYRYWDQSSCEGTNYCRLKLKHTSGEFSYSPIVSATVKIKQPFLSVYPNPVKNELTLKFNGTPSNNAVVEIIDVAERVIERLRLLNPFQTVDVGKLPAGVYTLRYTGNERPEFVRVMKQ